MDMEKRTLLAIVISIVIMLGWYQFVAPPAKQNTNKTTKASAQQPAAVQTPAVLNAAPATGVTTPAPVAAAAAKRITVETPLYIATFDSKGASLTSLKLKRYRQTMAKESALVDLIKTPMPHVSLNGFDDRTAVFATNAPENLEVKAGVSEISFETLLPSGLRLRKVYSLNAKDYLLGFRTEYVNAGAAALKLDPQIGVMASYPLSEKTSRYYFEGPVVLKNGKELAELKLKSLKEIGLNRDHQGAVNWFGYEDKYFLQALIVDKPVAANVQVSRSDDRYVASTYTTKTFNLGQGQQAAQSFHLFVGPKEWTTLKQSGYSLKKALSFGSFIDIFAKPLLVSMNWINTYVNSYGWSIIILTFFIKLLLYPLSLKSFKSMKELQKVQPIMKELQEKYKDDRQRLNQEMMQLYQTHQINPMGGCLPLLLQMPILFALYRVFYAAIELRHVPFHVFGTWLPDLSTKDPYYILPVLMTVTMFIQQKMTPTAGDATQQKIMLYTMPLMMLLISYNLPSGLILYWFVSNILSIAQQAWINRVHA
ncbi:MAG: Membrane protein insertase YidC [Deltaproteobacteria bacterium ADurb.Bin510]|nr:MAG: Membrane protein insertase YidC [Deltaproteobacteria bacterium ADurb.Bin510]